MHPLALRAIFRLDQVRFALFRARYRPSLRVEDPASPNLRLAHLRLEPEARFDVGPGFATERQPGNRIWVQAGGQLRLERDVWLRTEYGPNWITVFPGARIRIGARALINGAMLHSKAEISVGEDSMIGFGSRVIDADLHDIDTENRERVEPVHIGDRVWIASDTLVLRGVQIGDDVVVGAGSIVTGDLPPRVLAVGAPARPIRDLGSRIGCR
jgi:acetyltransferase-like isoleucine patch superfamily enzyme